MKKYPLLLTLLALIVSLSPLKALAVNESAKTDFDPFMKGTLLSEPTVEVPWENESEFIEQKEKMGAPFLMAAYKTVLPDPLPGEEYNVHLAASYISGTVLEPGKVFSQNKTAGPYTAERGFQAGPTYHGTEVGITIGGGVCKLSSTLFNVAVLSNLEIVERHTHNMPVPYVPYGQDATVSYGSKDFKFKNSTQSPILIMAKGVDNILYIGFYGQTEPPQVTWSHEVINVVKAPVICKKSSEVPVGTEKVIHEGMDGALIRSWITMTYPDGRREIRCFGKVNYNPLPFIKEISC